MAFWGLGTYVFFSYVCHSRVGLGTRKFFKKILEKKKIDLPENLKIFFFPKSWFLGFAKSHRKCQVSRAFWTSPSSRNPGPSSPSAPCTTQSLRLFPPETTRLSTKTCLGSGLTWHMQKIIFVKKTPFSWEFLDYNLGSILRSSVKEWRVQLF